jgi:dTDP-4-amino-4,6-dideoxygalactose transaminase
MLKKINLSEPFLDTKDEMSVKKSVRDGWVSTAGKSINEFEKLISKYEKYQLYESKNLHDRSICIPSSANMNIKKINFIFNQINKSYKKFQKKK